MEGIYYDLNKEKVSKYKKGKATKRWLFFGVWHHDVSKYIALTCSRFITTTGIQGYNKLEFFVEDDIYWAPASTTAHLYSQLASKKYREIPRDQLRLTKLDYILHFH